VTMDAGANTPMRPSHEPSTFMRSVRLLLIVVIFAVVGPLVGTVSMAGVGLIIYGLTWLNQISSVCITGVDTTGVCWVGAVPAVIAGGLIGIRHTWFGGAGGLFALGVGVLVGAGLEFLVYRSAILGDKDEFTGLFLATVTLSTLVCWRIVEPLSFLRGAHA
jgi:hypothetical protein